MEPGSTSRRFALTFDSFVTVLDVAVDEVLRGVNVRPSARVRFSGAVVSEVVLDWQADVDLLSVDVDPPELVLRGTPSQIKSVDDGIAMEIRAGVDLFDDVGSSGAQIENAAFADIAWSTLMAAGANPTRVNVEKRGELPQEAFRVLVPIYGMEVVSSFEEGSAKFLQPTGKPPVEVPSHLRHLAGPFIACSGVVEVEVRATTLFEAEERGLEEIDYSLGTLLLRQRSASSDRRPSDHDYLRDRSVAVIGRYPVVAVLGRWGRRWIRDVRETSPARQRPLTVEIEGGPSPPRAAIPPATQQAISAWQRAVQERDWIAELMALWESLEFYSAGVKVPRAFTRSELRSVRQRACTDLNGTQQERVEFLLGMLNSAPVMVRLQRAAVEDGVILSLGDVAVLHELRHARNDLVHGRAATRPERSALRKGLGIANRLLLARISRVADPTAQGREADSDGAPGTTLLWPDEGSRASKVSDSFTVQDKYWAEQAAEAAMLAIPFVDGGRPIPMPVVAEIRQVWGQATGEDLVRGVTRACDVAIKHLAKHFFSSSLEEALDAAGMRLVNLGREDAADFGRDAYKDAETFLWSMVSAMKARGRLRLSGDMMTVDRLFPAGSAALFSLLFELADRYGIPPARAAGNLGQEIGTIVPKNL